MAGVKLGRALNVMEVKVLVTSRVRLCNPVDRSPPGSFVHILLQAGILSGLPLPSPRVIFRLRDQTWDPALQADFRLSEPPGSPKLWKLAKEFKLYPV